MRCLGSVLMCGTQDRHKKLGQDRGSFFVRLYESVDPALAQLFRHAPSTTRRHRDCLDLTRPFWIWRGTSSICVTTFYGLDTRQVFAML